MGAKYSPLGPIDSAFCFVFQAVFFKDMPLRIIFCCCLVAKSCLTLCNPMDCSLPGSPAREISQAKILEWVAISLSRGSY